MPINVKKVMEICVGGASFRGDGAKYGEVHREWPEIGRTQIISRCNVGGFQVVEYHCWNPVQLPEICPKHELKMLLEAGEYRDLIDDLRDWWEENTVIVKCYSTDENAQRYKDFLDWILRDEGRRVKTKEDGSIKYTRPSSEKF